MLKNTIKIIIPIILFTMLYDFIGEQKKQFNLNDYIVKDGVIYLKGSTLPFTGLLTDTLGNKVLEYELVKGIKYGTFKVMTLDSIVQISGNLIDNKYAGKWTYFYPTGELESVGFFKNDSIDNRWTWFYKNGKVKETGFFRDGKREGDWLVYDEDGKLAKRIKFRNGYKVYEVRRLDIKNI